MGPRRIKQLSNFAKLFGKKTDIPKTIDVEKTPVLSGAAEKLADAPITEDDLKAVNRALLKEKGIEPNSLRQLMEAPNTIEDPELKKWAFDLHKKWDASNKKIQESNLDKILENVQKSQKQRATSGYKLFEEGAPTSQEMRLRKLKELFEQKAEGVKDIDVSPLSDFSKKAAAIAGLTAGGSAAASLIPEEAEAGVKGSAAARKKLLETTEKVMDAWTSGKKGASGGRELREQLQNQLDLDPTGTAKKEALRRLAAKTEVRQNPTTGEHEFKVYRGGVKDRFSESPQSFTTDPEVAQEFADAYGGNVKEVWLPASKVGSVPSIMKEGQYLSSEGEVIAKPFKAQSAPYTPKEESLHERISKRGKPEESTDLYEGWPEDVAEAAKKSSKAAAIGGAIGVGTLAAPTSASANVATKKPSLQEYLQEREKKYGVSKKEIGESLQTAGEFFAPFSKLMMFLSPTEAVSDAEEEAELKKIKENKERALSELFQNIPK